MDSLEKNSEFGIWFTAASFALDFVLPEEYRFIEKVSQKLFNIGHNCYSPRSFV